MIAEENKLEKKTKQKKRAPTEKEEQSDEIQSPRWRPRGRKRSVGGDQPQRVEGFLKKKKKLVETSGDDPNWFVWRTEREEEVFLSFFCGFCGVPAPPTRLIARAPKDRRRVKCKANGAKKITTQGKYKTPKRKDNKNEYIFLFLSGFRFWRRAGFYRVFTGFLPAICILFVWEVDRVEWEDITSILIHRTRQNYWYINNRS